jgi:ATP phosphoribosyltransferase regulatory subunit
MKGAPTISLPQGVRDVLPEEAEKIARVESAILTVFRSHGFKRVITPLLEYVDVITLGVGEALEGRILKFIDQTGRVMAVRPDITPQIARLVSTKMRDSRLPLKLYYNENVLRYMDEGSKTREVLQIGAEYISKAATPGIDAEMITMAIEALSKAGVKNFKIDIGDIGFVRSVIERLAVGEAEKAKVKELLKRKDTCALNSYLTGLRVGKKEKTALAGLTTLYGEEKTVNKALSLFRDPSLRDSLEYMKAVLKEIKKTGYGRAVTVDLGEARGFDYYTGIIYEGFAPGVGSPLLSGGRYDTLLKKYGREGCSTGFAFDTENMVEALLFSF